MKYKMQQYVFSNYKVTEADNLSGSSKSKKASVFSDVIVFPNSSGGRCMWKETSSYFLKSIFKSHVLKHLLGFIT